MGVLCSWYAHAEQRNAESLMKTMLLCPPLKGGVKRRRKLAWKGHHYVVLSTSVRKKGGGGGGVRNLSSTGPRYVGSLFTDEEQEKLGSFCTLTLLPKIPDLFMTSLIQCLVQNDSAHGSCSWVLFDKILSLTNRPRNRVKKNCQSFQIKNNNNIPLISMTVGLLRFGSPLSASSQNDGFSRHPRGWRLLTF